MTIKNETIVDRVVERIKKQPIGDLITEEDLHDIVKEAIPKAFFEDRYDNSFHAKKIPPLIVEIMQENLKEAASEAVKQWTIENAELLTEYWKKVTDEGLMKYVQKIQNEQATLILKSALKPMIDNINEQRFRSGLNAINLDL